MPDPIGGVQPFAELARGRTSVVYKGYQRDPGRFVLLKTVRRDESDSEDLIRRFEAEAEIAAHVRHPNVVEVYGGGREGAVTYLLTEFVEGLDLRALIERGPVPPALAVLILSGAARGLAAVHASGVLHRDLKPGNLLVSNEGAVKLADFGFASLVAPDEADEMRGTLAYLAPEIVRGDLPTEASDLFSIGAMLPELLTGRAAFAREGDGATLDAILHYDPVAALAADPRFPPALSDLAVDLLAKDPIQRLADASHLAKRLGAIRIQLPAEAGDLAAFLHDPASYTPQPAPPARVAPASVPERPARRPRWAVAASVLVVAMLGVAGVMLAPDREAPDSAPMLAPAPLVLAPPDSALSNEPVILDDALNDELPAEDAPVPVDDLDPMIASELEADQVVPAPEQDSIAVSEPAASTDPASPSTGTLTVVAEPWARIRIDGEPRGTTPLAALTLPTGSHRVTFENPDFPSHTVDVDIGADEPKRLALSLWDLVGRVTLVVSPWAEVAVNGAAWDTVPPQERPLILTPGEHRLTFTHPALGSRETTLRIAAGESRTLRVDLEERLP